MTSFDQGQTAFDTELFVLAHVGTVNPASMRVAPSPSNVHRIASQRLGRNESMLDDRR
ncbi:MAG: hypothetical protein RLZZ591_2961 [Pseudomonadota bacterium]|jgi:hypothetical protein